MLGCSCCNLVQLLLVVHIALYLQQIETNDASALSTGPKTRVAVFITGQVLRLELGSKIENLVKVNLHKGLYIDLFILLDNQLEEHKAVKRGTRYNSENCIYRNLTADRMEQLISSQISIQYMNKTDPRFSCRVRLEPPKRSNFPLTGLNPVCGFQSSNCTEKDRQTEYATSRFQNHMRWQAGLRECVKWMQAVEYDGRHFYDFVMRLREDTLVFAPFIMYVSGYINSIAVSASNGWYGLNDHDIMIDRKFADLLFRGLAEDYYFQEGQFSSHESISKWWDGPEILLLRMSTFYGVNVEKKSICLFPFAPIDGRLSVKVGNGTIMSYSMGWPNKTSAGITRMIQFHRRKCPMRKSATKWHRNGAIYYHNRSIKRLGLCYVKPMGLDALILKDILTS